MADTFDEALDDALPQAPLDPQPAVSTIPSPAQTARLPLINDPSSNVTPEGGSETPSLGDVRSVLHGWLRGRIHAVRTFLGARRAIVACLAALCVAGLAALAYSAWDATRTPSRELIEAYVQEHLGEPPRVEGAGPFAPQDPLALSSVEVVDARPSTTRRDASDVQVALVYANDVQEARVDERLTYVRAGDTWNCTASTTGNVSYHALAGVNQQQVIEQLGTLFEEADADAGSASSLATLYQTAEAEVVDEQFDKAEQTDRLSLRCTSRQGFATYACGLTADFRFVPASGAWELVEVAASEDAESPHYDALVGTWQGTFVGQEADGARCLSAQEQGLTIAIDEVTGQPSNGMTVTGTVSGTVHAHDALVQDVERREGDELIDGIAFTAELTRGSDGLTFSGPVAYPDGSEKTKAILTLTFGTSDDPTAAQATLATAHTYQGVFFFLSRTAHFADTYTLEHVA